MHQLFSGLLGKVARKTLQVLIVAPERQRPVAVGGAEFLIKLAVQFGMHFGGYFVHIVNLILWSVLLCPNRRGGASLQNGGVVKNALNPGRLRLQ
jgi:hypothetical protein